VPFSDVQAQDRAIGIIRAALRSGRVPHAWLFSGPDGVGKGMVARGLAAALVCEREGDDGCGSCLPCRKVADRVHPDVVEVTPEGPGRLVKIDQVRAVSRTFRFAPYEGRHRVVLFPEADRLNEEASNALLKSLEEPPERTILVLVTARPQSLLDTIRSRCHAVRFSPLPRELCARILCEQGVDPDEAPVAAALAEGSAGRALELFRSGVLDVRRATVEAVGGLSAQRPGELFDLAADWTTGASAAEAREALRQRLDVLSSWYRDLLVVSSGGRADDLIHSDVAEQALGAGVAQAEALRCLDRIQEARGALELNAGARLTCERLLLGLATGGR